MPDLTPDDVLRDFIEFTDGPLSDRPDLLALFDSPYTLARQLLEAREVLRSRAVLDADGDCNADGCYAKIDRGEKHLPGCPVGACLPECQEKTDAR